MEDMVDGMVNAMQKTAAPYYPKSMWDDFRETFHKIDLPAKMIPIYQDSLSQEDLAAVLAFYKTVAGQHLLETQPYMMAQAQERFTALGRQLGVEVAERHKDEILAAQKKYQEEMAAKQNSSKKQN